MSIIIQYLVTFYTTNLVSRQWLIFANFDDFFMEFIIVGPAYIRRWVGVGWVVVKAYTKKQDDTNSRVSNYDMYMYPQRANIPLQVLDRHAMTVGAISSLHKQMEPCISPVINLLGLQKGFWKSRPVEISQWRQ